MKIFGGFCTAYLSGLLSSQQKTNAITIVASSEEEALAKVLDTCYLLYAKSNGYTAHSAALSEVTQEQLDYWMQSLT